MSPLYSHVIMSGGLHFDALLTQELCYIICCMVNIHDRHSGTHNRESGADVDCMQPVHVSDASADLVFVAVQKTH